MSFPVRLDLILSGCWDFFCFFVLFSSSWLVEAWITATAIWHSTMHIFLFQERFGTTKEKCSPSPVWVSAALLHPRALSQGFAVVIFLSCLPHPRTLQSVSAITVECRLLWQRQGLLTGFGLCVCVLGEHEDV